MDIFATIVEKGFQNTADDRTAHKQLAVYARSHGGRELWEWCFKNRQRLPGFIDDVWQWETMDQSLPKQRLPRMEILRAAAGGACVCEGRWAAAVATSLIANKINVQELCGDIVRLLEKGRCPDCPVIVLAGKLGGEGKSLLLKALLSVYGDGQVFETPVAGSFPLVDLMNSKVCFFDEYCARNT